VLLSWSPAASKGKHTHIAGFGFNYRSTINSVWLFSHGCRALRHGDSVRLVVIAM